MQEPLSAGWAFAASLACLLALLTYLRWQTCRHEATLRRVPHRVHVAGTRGKSTVVRLVAAGVRETGRTAVGKLTGTDPTWIDGEGRHRSWFRPGLPSVREQARALRRAEREGAEVAILECMAIHPEFLWASEHRLVAADVTVITNARPDHWEALGPDDHAMARALVETVPVRGSVLVADELLEDPYVRALFEDRAQRLGTHLHVVPLPGTTPYDDMRALASNACRLLGTPSEVACRGMDRLGFRAMPVVRDVTRLERQFCFVDAFSCNDPASLQRLAQASPKHVRRPDAVLLNARADRPIRTRRFLRFVERVWPEAHVVLAGHDPWAVRRAERSGAGERRVRAVGSHDPEAALRMVAELVPAGGTAWGVGNYAGLARPLLQALDEVPVAC